MMNGFNVVRRLENGEDLQVAWRPNRPLAERLVHDLMESWPAEYGIEEAARKPIPFVPYMRRGNFGAN